MDKALKQFAKELFALILSKRSCRPYVPVWRWSWSRLSQGMGLREGKNAQ